VKSENIQRQNVRDPMHVHRGNQAQAIHLDDRRPDPNGESQINLHHSQLPGSPRNHANCPSWVSRSRKGVSRDGSGGPLRGN
jgi:hypothetical protein